VQIQLVVHLAIQENILIIIKIAYLVQPHVLLALMQALVNLVIHQILFTKEIASLVQSIAVLAQVPQIV